MYVVCLCLACLLRLCLRLSCHMLSYILYKANGKEEETEMQPGTKAIQKLYHAFYAIRCRILSLPCQQHVVSIYPFYFFFCRQYAFVRFSTIKLSNRFNRIRGAHKEENEQQNVTLLLYFCLLLIVAGYWAFL